MCCRSLTKPGWGLGGGTAGEGALLQDLEISPTTRSPGEVDTTGTALETREGDV